MLMGDQPRPGPDGYTRMELTVHAWLGRIGESRFHPAQHQPAKHLTRSQATRVSHWWQPGSRRNVHRPFLTCTCYRKLWMAGELAAKVCDPFRRRGPSRRRGVAPTRKKLRGDLDGKPPRRAPRRVAGWVMVQCVGQTYLAKRQRRKAGTFPIATPGPMAHRLPLRFHLCVDGNVLLAVPSPPRRELRVDTAGTLPQVELNPPVRCC